MSNRFDTAAATWDEDPVHTERARALVRELVPLIQRHNLRTALDYGGGTGLLAAQLAPHLAHITLMDTSAGMVEEARRKIAAHGLDGRMAAVTGDLLREEHAPKYDLIVILMTLHHILDTEGILRAFYDHLHPGGWLCIGDLEEEDGSFHAEFPDFDGHNGFDREVLAGKLREAGFRDVDSRLFFSIDRPGRSYPVFLMTGNRKR